MQGLWSGNQFLKRSNYLKTCSTSFPGAACPTLHAELPSGCVEGHSCSSRGFSLWKRQRANALGKCQFVVDENYAWGFWSLPLWWPHHKLISGAVSLQVLCHVDRASLQKKKKIWQPAGQSMGYCLRHSLDLLMHCPPEEEKLKLYTTSCSFCLCISACSS